MDDLPPAIPAATLVLMRPEPDGPPKLLLMERTGHMAFAAGAIVFPGGRVDASDRDAAEAYPKWPDADLRIAALRETLEEVGIAAAVEPRLAGERHAALRDRLERGEGFSNALRSEGLALSLDRLVPFARWLPNLPEPRRFDATFYLAEAPVDAPPPTAQAGEARRVFWASAAEMLAEVDAGRARAIFPTRRNLERLARFASFDEARADAERHPIRTITPWVEKRNGEDWLCIPDDAGYPVTAELLANATRG
jgi:8-oxo-dGTP pyrophosphatase MutT (NUDIX family)